MRLSRKSLRVVLLALGLLDISLGWLCWRQTVQLARREMEVAAKARAQRESPTARRRLDAILVSRADTTRRLAEARAKYTVLNSPAPEPRKPVPLSIRPKENLNLSPAHLLRLRKTQRLVIQNQYGVLLAALKLPPEKLEGLKRLLADRNQAVIDARQIARESGDPDWFKISERVQQPLLTQIDGEIQALLGEDQYQSYRSYEGLARTNSQLLPSVALELDDAGLSITPDQQIQLARFVYAGSAPTAGNAEPQALTRDSLALTRAASLFSPAQLQRLEALLGEKTRETELIRRLGFPGQ